jgi:hypothetical protein
VLPRGAAREQQPAEVGAREHQQDADDRHQQPQGPAELIVQRRRQSGPRRFHVDRHLPPLGIALREAFDAIPIEHAQLGPRLLDRHARLQAGDQREPGPGSHRVGNRGDGDPDVRLAAGRHAREAWFGDADDRRVHGHGDATILDVDAGAEDARLAVESMLPVPPTHDCDGGSARRVVTDLQQAPQRGPDAERIEEISRDDLGADRFAAGARL